MSRNSLSVVGLSLGVLSIFLWAVLALGTGVPRAPESPGESSSTLQVRLLEPEGSPARACVVSLWLRTGDGRKETRPGHTGTCDGGLLFWKGLPPGDYHLVAAVEGATLFERDLLLGPGDSLDLGEVRLEPGANLEVLVVSGARAVPTAEVLVSGRRERTNAEGRARFVGTPVGTLPVQVHFDGELLEEVVTTTRYERTELLLTIDPGRLRGILGVHFVVNELGAAVEKVLPTGPAAGIVLIGDVIVEANGRQLAGRTQKEVEVWLNAPAGNVDQFVILRNGDRLEAEVTRADILDVIRASD